MSTTTSSTTNSSSSILSNNTNQPFVLYAITNRPPGSSSSSNSSGSGSGGGARKNSRDPIQIICPYTGSNVTSTHSLRCPTSSSNKNSFGVHCLLPVPLTNMMGGGDDDGNSLIFLGHGGSSTTSSTNTNKNSSKSGGKDDYAFLLSRLSSSSSSNTNNNNPKWKVRLPQPLSHTFQSISISNNSRYIAAGTTSGSILLWDWTLPHGDNLINVWKGHYRSITCVVFDNKSEMLFSGGEDGVVNVWNLMDLIDVDNINNGVSGGGSSSSVHPFQTWSEHSLPITSLCVLSGSSSGSSTTRLVSSSLDRNIILMEVGCNSSGGRTLARICLPSGIHTVITNINNATCSERLYCGAHDGNVYCIDLNKFALHETTQVVDGSGSFSGGTTVVNVNQGLKDDFESLLMGSHVLLPSSTSANSSNNFNNYTSELKGHTKAVTSLAILDPSSLISSSSSSSSGTTNVLLASGSDDGTLRIWDLNSRSCIRVIRPWSSTTTSTSVGGGMNNNSSATSSSSTSSPPITGIIAVPKSSLSSSWVGGVYTTLVTTSRRGSSTNAHGYLVEWETATIRQYTR